MHENGTIILKFFLNISKDEQARRFIKRIDDKSKNWKFSEGDIKEREHWDDYQKAFQETLTVTSTPIAPWYVIPADKKWYARLAVSEIIVNKLKELKLTYPQVSKEQLLKLHEYKKMLEG